MSETTLSVEVAFTTDPLDADPVWEDITDDVRSWDTSRGRNRELERFQPGRATIVLGNRDRRYDSQMGPGTQFIDLPGTSGNYASTPDSPAVSITGDIDIRVRVALDDWTPAAIQVLCAKRVNPSQLSWRFHVAASGALAWGLSSDGSTEVGTVAVSSPGLTNGATHEIKVTWRASDGRTQFFVDDVQTGTDQTLAAGSIFDSNSPVEIGSRNNGGTENLAGNVYYAEVRDGIDGPVAARFDANTVPQTGTRTPDSWTSSTGEQWTVNGDAWAWGGEWGSPHAGNIRSGRRVRIRETFDAVTYPVFDGFVDKWVLDYPGKGKDATATIVATDLFKLCARTDLPRSVYALEVEADEPALWWHLDEGLEKLADGFALNSGAGGSTRDGAWVAEPGVGTQGLIVNDPGTSITTDSRSATRLAVLKQGATLANGALPFYDSPTFSVEVWVRLDADGNSTEYIWSVGDAAAADVAVVYTDPAADGTTGRFRFVAEGTIGVETPIGGVVPGVLHHVVAVVEASGQMAIYLDGVRSTTIIPGATGTSLSGVTRSAGGDLHVAYSPLSGQGASFNWRGSLDEFAVYLEDIGTARVEDHYEMGTHPWQGDPSGIRINRILDLVGLAGNQRELDTGVTSFQSVTLGTTAMEHLLKVMESEYASLLFVSADGKVRFVSRDTVLGRTPSVAVYGDLAGEVGYTNFALDDGDETIRNRATISRYNGVAKVAVDDDSISEFGRFAYVLDGLLNDTEAESQNHANFVVLEFADQRRRITSLSLGPPADGEEDDVYPAMLGPELGDAITVRSRPLGGGDLFEQTCVVEGIHAAGAPGGERTVTFTLSPEFPLRDWEDDVQIGYAQRTTSLNPITATLIDLTSLSVNVTAAANRRIRVTGFTNWLSSVAGDRARVTIADGASAQYQRGGEAGLQTTGLVNNVVQFVHTPSAGAQTYKLRAQRESGTGNLTMFAAADSPAFILVEDIGPA